MQAEKGPQPLANGLFLVRAMVETTALATYTVAMVLFLSALCFLAALGILIRDLFFPHFFVALPVFTATAAALVGVLIAAVEYAARKTRKKRRAPLALLVCNAVVGSCAALLWLVLLLGAA